MRYRELPKPLQVYILAHFLFLAPLVVAVPRQPAPTDWWLVGALLFFTALFSTWKLELTICEGRMTPVFATVCLSMLLQGPQAAVLCSALGALMTTFVRPPKKGWKVELLRPRLYYAWFNLANGALAGGVAALAFGAVRPLAPQTGMDLLVALTVFACAYYLANTLGVALAIALQQRLRWATVWQQYFLWTGPGFFASAAAAAGIQALYPALSVWSLLFLPPLYLVYYSYRFYLDRLREYASQLKQDTARIEELSVVNRTLLASLERTVDASAAVHRAQWYARALGEAAGLNALETEILATAAVVHDADSLAAPATAAGEAQAGSRENGATAASYLAEVLRAQQERWDGHGYPSRLKGTEIPVGARILAIVGMFDLLTTARPYRPAMSYSRALGILNEGAGKQFDPQLVEQFVRILPEVTSRIETREGELRAGAGLPAAGPAGNGPLSLHAARAAG